MTKLGENRQGDFFSWCVSKLEWCAHWLEPAQGLLQDGGIFSLTRSTLHSVQKQERALVTIGRNIERARFARQKNTKIT